MRSGELVRVEVDPALVLAEVLLRLRHAGADVSTDQGSMSCAYEHLTGVLVALGVPVDVGVLGEADYMFLRCVAARGRRAGAPVAPRPACAGTSG